ncbi:pyruvate kinase [Tautonia plasticadhaerens]|uniref:Pyruvate kinase n=1 Tax=Tautonia plasticadhaerens TaxID=2527974 RepID=A0A518GYP3_9BACT|nr:pyruvate kinase [Tautonia plasticadhaerens]QDV33652.1 Pyruvate kinase [Tautonia plasticadhaerens]
MRIDADESLAGVRTKIVATVGPASRAPEVLGKLLDAGVDVFRLNFSHGSQDDHSATLADIRRVAAERERAVGVLMDLGGPKIRLGELPGGMLSCELDAEYALVRGPGGAEGELTCTYPDLPDDLTIGDPVLFADGTVGMEVVDRSPGRAVLKVVLPGQIRSRQGINVPGSGLSLPSLTDKDLGDLDWAADHDVDFIALSFVRSGTDLARLRHELDRRNIKAKVIAKVEKPQAVDELESILALSDVVMVARGDLGVEVDVARVPAIQKRILVEAHKARVPVIIATQMLNSMERSSRPTRAEASDVFNAAVDGTDAVMLSGETAIGDFPVEAVRTMSRILAEAERPSPSPSTTAPGGPADRAGWISPITEAVVESASLACRRLDAALLVVATRSGRSALAVSMQRNRTPTIALAPSEGVARQLSLLWGVVPLILPGAGSGGDGPVDHALSWAKTKGLVSTGDRVVVLRGFFPDHPTHNTMVVREVEHTA